MIKYKSTNFRLALCSPVFASLKAIQVSLCWGLFAVAMIVALNALESEMKASAHMDVSNTLYASLTATLSFMMVFRTGQAYSRFWDGCTLVHHIAGDWFDAASSCIAFCRYSSADREAIEEFQQTLIRLVSLLHAMALGELEGSDHVDKIAHGFELIDCSALTRKPLLELKRSQHRPEVVLQWVQSLIIENVKSGVLSVPPPLLTRTFQDFGNGMVKYHEAVKYAQVPIPYPYTATAEVLLIFHTLLTPFVLCSMTTRFLWLCVFTFLLVFSPWCLHSIATELENPFEQDANDLDMEALQRDTNTRLVALVCGASMHVPKLMESPDVASRRVAKQFIATNRGSDPRVSASFTRVVRDASDEAAEDDHQTGSATLVLSENLWTITRKDSDSETERSPSPRAKVDHAATQLDEPNKAFTLQQSACFLQQSPRKVEMESLVLEVDTGCEPLDSSDLAVHHAPFGDVRSLRKHEDDRRVGPRARQVHRFEGPEATGLPRRPLDTGLRERRPSCPESPGWLSLPHASTLRACCSAQCSAAGAECASAESTLPPCVRPRPERPLLDLVSGV